MTELTDHLVSERLMEDPDLRQAYHTDPFYRAEMTLFRRALDAAHRALTDVGHPEADRVMEVLGLGIPNLDASRRTALARKLIEESAGAGPIQEWVKEVTG